MYVSSMHVNMCKLSRSCKLFHFDKLLTLENFRFAAFSLLPLFFFFGGHTFRRLSSTQLLFFSYQRQLSVLKSMDLLVSRENDQLSKYGDTKSARNIMLTELKKLLEANPLFRDKLLFPNFKNSRLRTLINQR